MRKPFKGTRLRYHAVDVRPVTLDARRERGIRKLRSVRTAAADQGLSSAFEWRHFKSTWACAAPRLSCIRRHIATGPGAAVIHSALCVASYSSTAAPMVAKKNVSRILSNSPNRFSLSFTGS